MPDVRVVRPGLFRVDTDGVRLLAGRCEACARLHFPAADTCPYCAAARCAPEAVGPAGHLRLFTAITSRPPGYAGPVPFGFGVVELDGTGLEVLGRLTEARLDHLAPGLPMRLVVDTVGADPAGLPIVTYAFAPAGPS